MATISFVHVGYITSISPGVIHHWWWNNAPAQRVWALSVDAMVPLPAQLSPAQLQITNIEYRENLVGGTPLSFEKEIHFWIKNTGQFSANYAVHMAVIQE